MRVLLAQQNTRPIAQQQWDTLRAVYPAWEAAYLDGPDGIESTLRQAGGGLTHTKANYIYGVLDALESAYGRLSLRFLSTLDDAAVRSVLESLPGIGHRSASLVMLFDLLRPAMPVDNNMERWSKRLELVPAQWNAAKVERWFDEAVPRDWEQRYALHLSGVQHGHVTCKVRQPLCGECVLREFCPSAGLFLAT